MRWYYCIPIGAALGILHGVTFAASIDALQQASFILYGSPYYIPVLATVVIDALAFSLTVTSEEWARWSTHVFFPYLVKILFYGGTTAVVSIDENGQIVVDYEDGKDEGY